jgi:nitrogen fixation protein FixH
MSQNSDPAPRPGGAAPAWRWPAIVVGLLVAHCLFMLTVAMIAVGDRSFVVVPRYYEQALAWDQTQALRRQSKKLGWRLGIETGRSVDLQGRRLVVFTLADAEGRPMHDATAQISYYHRRQAQQVERITLSATAPGRFERDLPMRAGGFWEFRVLASSGGQEFIADLTHFVEDDGR